MSKLSPKQLRFCVEYLTDLNATQAAIRAGYSKKTAYSQGQRLLKNVEVQAEISKRQAKRLEKAEITQERVLDEYRKIAFLDIRKAFTEEGNLKPIADLDDDTAAAVAGLDFEEVFEMSRGHRDHVGNIHKIKLTSKLGALDSLSRYLKMFTDRVELTGKEGGPLTVQVLDSFLDDTPATS